MGLQFYEGRNMVGGGALGSQMFFYTGGHLSATYKPYASSKPHGPMQ